jgi:hypothetical protein
LYHFRDLSESIVAILSAACSLPFLCLIILRKCNFVSLSILNRSISLLEEMLPNLVPEEGSRSVEELASDNYDLLQK